MWDDNKTLGMLKKWHSVIPLLAFVGNQNMRNKMEKNNWKNKWMGWLGDGGINAKIDKESFAILKQIVNI